ncbi:MAG: hypothetical protein MK193_12990 [Lentisphaeria bacterium]|nr:hypothetical protein [Lentisphaeria bacterium]
MFYITAFGAFIGRYKNGSETLVRSLLKDPLFVDIEFRILPVTWQDFDSFFEAIKHQEITGIIGFGEGSEPSVVVECTGQNIASGIDEAGFEKTDVPINHTLPETNGSRIVGVDELGIQKSDDAGQFLCNYELFHINSLNIQTSAFIHLPPQLDTPDNLYLSKIRTIVIELLKRNIPIKNNV